MALSQEIQIAVHRGVMAGLGGGAGLALWALGDNWANPALPAPLYLALFTFVAVFSAVALALAGPVPTARALGGALMLAVPAVALVSWAGRRHVVATDLLDDPVMLSVMTGLVFFATPFLLVWVQARADWRRYAALFDAAWTMAVRYGVAWVFVGVFWLVAFLSNALLELVEIDLIDQMLQIDWVRFGMTGAVLGLGLAVIYELRQTISPYLILRLLRLLVPVVLVVVAVFLAAVPFRGLSELFGEFSAAGTLMGAAIAAITLISTALDKDDAAAVSTTGIRLATRGLALMLPLLTGLAVWAVVLRVRQYGWTPDRVLAISVALFLLTYGAGYCGSILFGHGWAGRIRRVNVAMALAVIGACALWLTPVVDAYRISTNSQVARFISGRGTLDQLDMWAMQYEWGKAGVAGVDRLEATADAADNADLLARITAVRTANNAYQFEQAVRSRRAPGNADTLARLMAVRPAGASLTAETFDELAFYRMTQWLDGCHRPLADGRPGCVMVRGDFTPLKGAETQGIVLYLDEKGQARGNHVLLRPGAGLKVVDVYDPVSGLWPILPGAAIAQVLDGAFDIRPSSGNALFVGGSVLVPGH
jgi:hypothetical protein